MAYLPIAPARLRHHPEPHPAHVPAQRRDAGLDRRARCRLLREGIRDYLPCATAQRTCPERARGNAHHVARPGHSDGCVRVPWLVPDRLPETLRPAHTATHRTAD